MNKMSPELLYAIEQSELSRARTAALRAGRVPDRRVESVAIEHEDRRKGPRRWLEKRALMARANVERD